MTLETVLVWSTIRAICVTSVALPLALIVERTIADTRLPSGDDES